MDIGKRKLRNIAHAGKGIRPDIRNIAHINDLHLANSVIKFTPIVAQGVYEAQSLPKRHEFGTSRTFKVGLWRSDVRACDSLGDDKLWHPISSRLDILEPESESGLIDFSQNSADMGNHQPRVG